MTWSSAWEQRMHGTGFYSARETHSKKDLWNLFLTLNQRCNLPWCFVGNFNQIAKRKKKRKRKKKKRNDLKILALRVVFLGHLT